MSVDPLYIYIASIKRHSNSHWAGYATAADRRYASIISRLLMLLSRFGYVDQNPVLFRDPQGLARCNGKAQGVHYIPAKDVSMGLMSEAMLNTIIVDTSQEQRLIYSGGRTR